MDRRIVQHLDLQGIVFQLELHLRDENGISLGKAVTTIISWIQYVPMMNVSLLWDES